MSHTGTGRENRLARESSPYLLLHRHNPVDWYPWGPEALEKARRESKPIFLSVGYSTCYWCHVMERESFSSPAIAELMNRWFVNVKLDREERPDLDEVYMTATQILTRGGGWPNSVWLTPELEPFYAGTYFPPEDRHGRPGFPTVLRGLAQAWETRRVEVEQQAEELADAVRKVLEERVRPGERPPSAEVAALAVEGLAKRYDAEWGGFGGAPKFPSPSNLFLLQALAERGDGRAAEMLSETLDQMARGGIYDQLGGGFHRYATDRRWRVPHFEKMLYDNGLLLTLYAREHARTGDPQAARVARETAAWVEREMTSPEGAFWSAIDAETEGDEGAFYVWTREQLAEVLGADGFAFAAPILGFDGAPFFEGGRYVLHLPEPLDEQAAERDLDLDALLLRLAEPKGRLFEARAGRERPLTDDKVLADWNGMMIAGLAEAGHRLGVPELMALARRAAGFVLAELRPEGSGEGGGRRLHHAWRGGPPAVAAVLADDAVLGQGLGARPRATGEAEWLAAAADLTGEQLDRLSAPGGGFFVAAESPDLLFRSQDPFDGAVPSANAVAALNLVELAGATGEARWSDQARAALSAFAPLVESFPEGSRMMALAALRWHEGPGRHPAAEVGAVGAGQPGAAPAGRTGGGVAALEGEAEAVVAVSARAGEPGEDGWRPLAVRLEIADGWHVHGNPAAHEYLVPTSVEPVDGTELREVEYPAGRPFHSDFTDDELSVYSGDVEVRAEVRSAGGPARLLVTCQACDDERCLPPVQRSLEIAARGE